MTSENYFTDNNDYKFQDYLYISNDPEENADNFDPNWASFREMNTDEERYQAIRKRWGNPNIPNPQINLTCRQSRNQLHSERSGSNEDSSSSSKTDSGCVTAKKQIRNRRRSRSCTRSYEKLISSLEKNFEVDYIHLRLRHKAELDNMLQFQLLELHALNNSFCFGLVERQFLQNQQEQEVMHLLTNQYQELQRFVGERNEDIVAYKKYMEEVKAFFIFYQKMNDNEITLQMTDEQYEHTVETERMYSLYNKYYN